MPLTKFIIRNLAALAIIGIICFGSCSQPAHACEEPLSDADLMKYYKPCYGSAGWCLRDKYKLSGYPLGDK